MLRQLLNLRRSRLALNLRVPALGHAYLLILLPTDFSFQCLLSTSQQLPSAHYVPGVMLRTFLQEAFLDHTPPPRWAGQRTF